MLLVGEFDQRIADGLKPVGNDFPHNMKRAF